MLTPKILWGLRAMQTSLMIIRNKGTKGTVSDPVQQLFITKIREYKQKSPDGKLVEPSPAILKELKSELRKIEKQFGGGPGVNMSSFPTFKFDEPNLDPIDEPTAESKRKKKKETKEKKK